MSHSSAEALSWGPLGRVGVAAVAAVDDEEPGFAVGVGFGHDSDGVLAHVGAGVFFTVFGCELIVHDLDGVLAEVGAFYPGSAILVAAVDGLEVAPVVSADFAFVELFFELFA